MKFGLSLSRRGIIPIILVLVAILVSQVLVWGGDLAVLSSNSSHQLLPLLLTAAALGTDAMTLAIGIGLQGVSWQDIVRTSLVIGLFHVGMPLIGALGGHCFGIFAGEIAHWLGAGIVAFIGSRMIWGCLESKQGIVCQWTLTGFPLLLLAAGVSIDALSVGFSLGAFGYNIFSTAITFGIFSAIMSAVGLIFGSRLGKFIGNRGEFVGGIVLIFLAIYMLF